MADENHPSTFKKFIEGTERALLRSRRNANRCGSRARSPSVSRSVDTGRKREVRISKRLSVNEVHRAPPVIEMSDGAADVPTGEHRGEADVSGPCVLLSPDRTRLRIVLVQQESPGMFLPAV